jgi:hypothetical protein
MNTKKVAEKFAKEPVRFVESEPGTRYVDGGCDRKEYFESQSGKRIVVECPHQGKPFARKSDGVVW